MNIPKERGLMVNNLILRMISAIVLAPLVIYSLYLGGIYFQILALISLFLMLSEWFSMNGRNKKPLFIGFSLGIGAFVVTKFLKTSISIYDMRHVMYVLCVVLICNVMLLNNQGKIIKIFAGVLFSLIGYMIIHMIVAPKPYGAPVKDLVMFSGSVITSVVVTFLLNEKIKETKFFTTGIVYILIPMLYITFHESVGTENFFKIAIWILLVVWSCDIFAYLGGRLIGGAKLAPKISPNKTWSGATAGAIATMTLSYFGISRFLQLDRMYILCITAIMIIAAIFGDLLESKAKRILSVKDSGNIIPGHGGILDRLDSLLMVLYVFVIAEIFGYLKLDLEMLLTSAKWI